MHVNNTKKNILWQPRQFNDWSTGMQKLALPLTLSKVPLLKPVFHHLVEELPA